MQIFENPYAVVIVFVLGFILLAVIGICFAVKGIKTANGRASNEVTSINKIESKFKNLGKYRQDRCLMYISISSDNPRGLISESKILSEIKHSLLLAFSQQDSSDIAVCDEKNFVVLANWDEKTTRENVQKYQGELNRCLLKYSALNIINVKIYLIIYT